MWNDLSNKIREIFRIPVEKVGFAVLDQEDHIVTINNDTELQNYYTSLRDSSEVQFVVQDLDSPDRASPFSASCNLCSMPLYLANIFTTWRQASTQSVSMPDDSNYAIRCLVQGQAAPFKVTLPKTSDVDDLKRAIGTDTGILVTQLVLFKVGIVYD